MTEPRITTTEATTAELRFIKRMGTFSEAVAESRITRRDLLEGYLKAFDKRVEWGSIDRERCLKLAHIELEKEMVKG